MKLTTKQQKILVELLASHDDMKVQVKEDKVLVYNGTEWVEDTFEEYITVFLLETATSGLGIK